MEALYVKDIILNGDVNGLDLWKQMMDNDISKIFGQSGIDNYNDNKQKLISKSSFMSNCEVTTAEGYRQSNFLKKGVVA